MEQSGYMTEEITGRQSRLGVGMQRQREEETQRVFLVGKKQTKNKSPKILI